MTNYERTASWLSACGKEPGPESLSVQLGCHLEEVVEFLGCLGFDDTLSELSARSSAITLQSLATSLKSGLVRGSILDRVGALDALCDCEVTGNGVAYLARMDKPSADQAVLESNAAKLVDGRPVVLPGGKIGKPEGWVPPDLTGYV